MQDYSNYSSKKKKMNELSIFTKDSADFAKTVKPMPETIICKPAQSKQLPDRMIKYENAEQLAKDISIESGSRHFVLVSGNFIFGDFFEALIIGKGYKVSEMLISTLSMSQENIDSLSTLINYAPPDSDWTRPFVEKLTLIISDYFFSHERRNLVPYLYEKLNNGRFQLAVAGTHSKIALIKTDCGRHIVIHGSANLRSSRNMEHLVIEEDKTLFDFNYSVLSNISDNFATIKKPLRVARLWEQVTK